MLAFICEFLFLDPCFLFFSMGDNLTSFLNFHQNQNRNKSKNSLAKKSMSMIELLKMSGHTVPLHAHTILKVYIEIPVLENHMGYLALGRSLLDPSPQR